MSSSPRSRPSQTAIVALAVGAVIVVVGVILALVGVNVLGAGGNFVNSLYPPIGVTEQGAKIRDLYTIVFVIAAAIFFVVEGLIIWTVVRYRRKPGDDTLPPQIHGNNIAELTWTLIPTLIVAFLFVVSWQTLNAVDTRSADAPTKIRAIAGQFQWQFDYLTPDGKTTLFTQQLATGADGGMVVPAGRKVLLSLVSHDVIHAFYVPQFLFKRDVVPGRDNEFDFKVNESDAGQTFRGQCAELCGTGHSIMLFEVHALSGSDFDTWLADQVAKASATPSPAPSGAPAASGAAGATIQITAKAVAFAETAIEAPAGAPFKIDFDNEDSGTPHNVAIHKDSAAGAEVFKGEIFSGVAKKTYDVPALDAGTYAFVCSVHASMTGTLTVK